MSKIDWGALARAGLKQLGLRPDEFWRLTPVELLLLTGRVDVPSPTTRDALERLLRAFPDTGKTR